MNENPLPNIVSPCICVCIEHQLQGAVDDRDPQDIITVSQADCEFLHCC